MEYGSKKDLTKFFYDMLPNWHQPTNNKCQLMAENYRQERSKPHYQQLKDMVTPISTQLFHASHVHVGGLPCSSNFRGLDEAES